jgi:electron transfer flavoprotein alpha subunit
MHASAEFTAGLSRLYVAEGTHYWPYLAEAFIVAAEKLIETSKPSIVLFPHTPETREWVPRLAARLGAGFVSDCTHVAIDGQDLVATKPVYGGGVIGEFVVRGSSRIVTIRPSVFEARQGASSAECIVVDVAAPSPARVTCLEEAVADANAGPRLKDAKVIVAGGRGVGGKDNWHFVEGAAAALGAAVGCSRPVADSGWVPSSHQVGLSGTLVAPDLYVAIGISGAVQHLAGISNAKTVVAINNDPEADIFSRADYGVVGDYKEILPTFVARVRQLKT